MTRKHKLSKNLRLLFLPNVTFPTKRALLVELWNNEFSERGHKIFWIMQPSSLSRKIRRVSWKGSDVFLTRSIDSQTFLSKILNRLLV